MANWQELPANVEGAWLNVGDSVVIDGVGNVIVVVPTAADVTIRLSGTASIKGDSKTSDIHIQ